MCFYVCSPLCHICQLNSLWQYRLAFIEKCMFTLKWLLEGISVRVVLISAKQFHRSLSNNGSTPKKTVSWKTSELEKKRNIIHTDSMWKKTQIKICAHNYRTKIYCITWNIADKKKLKVNFFSISMKNI